MSLKSCEEFPSQSESQTFTMAYRGPADRCPEAPPGPDLPGLLPGPHRCSHTGFPAAPGAGRAPSSPGLCTCGAFHPGRFPSDGRPGKRDDCAHVSPSQPAPRNPSGVHCLSYLSCSPWGHHRWFVLFTEISQSPKWCPARGGPNEPLLNERTDEWHL